MRVWASSCRRVISGGLCSAVQNPVESSADMEHGRAAHRVTGQCADGLIAASSRGKVLLLLGAACLLCRARTRACTWGHAGQSSWPLRDYAWPPLSLRQRVSPHGRAEHGGSVILGLHEPCTARERSRSSVRQRQRTAVRLGPGISVRQNPPNSACNSAQSAQ